MLVETLSRYMKVGILPVAAAVEKFPMFPAQPDDAYPCANNPSFSCHSVASADAENLVAESSEIGSSGKDSALPSPVFEPTQARFPSVIKRTRRVLARTFSVLFAGNFAGRLQGVWTALVLQAPTTSPEALFLSKLPCRGRFMETLAFVCRNHL